MAGQEQKPKGKNLQEKAEEVLEENDIIDMLINDKTSVDDIMGPLPSTPSYFSTNISDLADRNKKFNEEFYGTPDKIESKKVKGSIPRFFEKMNTKYFGGTIDEVVKGAPGIIDEGTQIYDTAVKEFNDIKGNLKEYNADVIKQENYLNKITNIKAKQDDMYLKLEKKEKQAKSLIKDITERLEENELNLNERKKLVYVLNDLNRRKENIELRTDEVSYVMVALDRQKDSLSNIVKANKTMLNTVRSSMKSTEFELQYFDTVVKTMPTTAGLSMVMPQLQNLGEKMSTYMTTFHEKLMENINEMSNGAYRPGSIISDQDRGSLDESVSGFMDHVSMGRNELRNAAKSTIYKK